MRGSEYAQLQAFVAIVEHGSLARASGFLGVSPSALSQTLRRLEERLGARLLNRTTRSLAPTTAGAALLDRIGPLMTDLDRAVDRTTAEASSVSGPVRINTIRLAALHVLAPRVSEFLAAFPDIVLDLTVDDRLIDIVAGGFDAGIRLGERLDQDMIAVPLTGALRMRVVASPAYIEVHGLPANPGELLKHACLNFRNPTDLSLYRWEFERDDRRLEVGVSGPLAVNEPEIAARAAEAGAGIAYLFEYQVGEAIACGRLVPLLEDWTPPFPGFYLYYPSRRHLPPGLRAFADFFRHRGATQVPGRPAVRPDGRPGAGALAPRTQKG